MGHIVASFTRASELLVAHPEQFDFVVSFHAFVGSPWGPSRPAAGFAQFTGPKISTQFDDTEKDHAGLYKTVSYAQMQKLLSFYKSVGNQSNGLFHCAAGISRSSAACLIFLCNWMTPQEALKQVSLAMLRDGHPKDLAPVAGSCVVKELTQHAHPNRRMVYMADHILRLNGVLVTEFDRSFDRRTPPDFGTWVFKKRGPATKTTQEKGLK